MDTPLARQPPWVEISLNLLPLVGVVFLGWNLFEVMLLYWFEAALILICGMGRVLWSGERPVRNAVGMLLFSPVYLGPAIAAVAAYGLVAVAMFYGPAPLERWDQYPKPAELRKLIVDGWLWVPMAMLLVHYARDYVRGWILSGAWRGARLVSVMLSLYGRMILLQVVTVATAAVVIKTGQGVLALGLLVSVKTALDLTTFAWRSRTRSAGASSVDSSALAMR